MKYLLTSELGFEAVNDDQALIKLAVHLIAMMDKKPVIIVDDDRELNLIQVMLNTVPSIIDENVSGFINIAPVCSHPTPERLQ